MGQSFTWNRAPLKRFATACLNAVSTSAKGLRRAAIRIDPGDDFLI
jgi:hypothetical protein